MINATPEVQCTNCLKKLIKEQCYELAIQLLKEETLLFCLSSKLDRNNKIFLLNDIISKKNLLGLDKKTSFTRMCDLFCKKETGFLMFFSLVIHYCGNNIPDFKKLLESVLLPEEIKYLYMRYGIFQKIFSSNEIKYILNVDSKTILLFEDIILIKLTDAETFKKIYNIFYIYPLTINEKPKIKHL